MYLVLIFVICCLNHVSTEDRSNETIYQILRTYYKTIPYVNKCNNNSCGERLLLTPYIKAKQYDKAKSAAAATPRIEPNIAVYSAFLTINEQYNSNMWFYYVPAINKNPKDAPLVVVTQGGPGGPILYDIYTQIGPYKVKSIDDIEENPYTWAAQNSLLFLAAPIGSAFSFTDDPRGYSTNETMVAKDLYVALQQFLTLFSELRSAPTYLYGHLYAAKHAVTLGYEIYQNRHHDVKINLKGLMLDNGEFDMGSLLFGEDYSLQSSLISIEDAEKIRKYKCQSKAAVKKGNTLKAYDLLNKAGQIIYASTCLPNPLNLFNNGPPKFETVLRFAQQPKTRLALHVGNATLNDLNPVFDKLKPDLLRTVTKELIVMINNYYILFVNGIQTPYLPSHLAELYYETLKYKNVDKFKNAEAGCYKYRGVTAGYVARSQNVIALYLRQAGNFPNADVPEVALAYSTSFFANNTV